MAEKPLAPFLLWATRQRLRRPPHTHESCVCLFSFDNIFRSTPRRSLTESQLPNFISGVHLVANGRVTCSMSLSTKGKTISIGFRDFFCRLECNGKIAPQYDTVANIFFGSGYTVNGRNLQRRWKARLCK